MREQQNMVLKYPITQWLHFFMWYFYLIPKVRFRGKMHTVIQGWKIEKKKIYMLWKSLLISPCHGWILVTWERLQQASKFRSKTSWTIYYNHNCCVQPFFFFPLNTLMCTLKYIYVVQSTIGFLHMNMTFILGIWKPSEVPGKGTGSRPVNCFHFIECLLNLVLHLSNEE